MGTKTRAECRFVVLCFLSVCKTSGLSIDSQAWMIHQTSAIRSSSCVSLASLTPFLMKSSRCFLKLQDQKSAETTVRLPEKCKQQLHAGKPVHYSAFVL